MRVRIYRNYEVNDHNYFQEVDGDSINCEFDIERPLEFIMKAIAAVDINAPKEAWNRNELDVEDYSSSPLDQLKREDVDKVHHIRINLNMGSGEDIPIHPDWNDTLPFFGNILSMDLKDTEWDSPYIISPQGHWVEASYITEAY